MRSNCSAAPCLVQSAAGPDPDRLNLHEVSGNLGHRVLLEMAGVSVEFPDAFRQLFGCHGIFVVHPTEGLLIQVETTAGGCLRRF